MVTVAIVGRPNVGKSTLFNRLVGERNAIIEDEPGVTRDRIYGKSIWNGKQFNVIDTGGFIPGSEDTMEEAVRNQAMIAVEEADSIIFMVDCHEGITRFDRDIAEILRRTEKPVTLVVNKSDNFKYDTAAYEFYELGIGEPFSISANNGRSTGDFLDHLVETFPDEIEEEEDERLKLAIVGRPNTGKSSLVNALLGTERNIVTDMPGTTRDSTDSVLKYKGEEIILIDTAGLRKKAKVDENVERWSMVRTARAIDRCDVGIILIDGIRGFDVQDKRIIGMLGEAKKGIIVAINKWDLLEIKDSDVAKEMVDFIHADMRTYDFVPVMFISALERTRIFKAVDRAMDIFNRRKERISTSKLNNVLKKEFEATPPPSVRGQDLRINYVTQVGTEPPLFTLFLNQPKLLPESYKRFIERKIREHFDLEGIPISLLFRRKNVKWEERG